MLAEIYMLKAEAAAREVRDQWHSVCRIGRRERKPRLAARPIMTPFLSKPSPLPNKRPQLEHIA